MNTHPRTRQNWGIKLVIVGEPAVGKTSLRRGYLGNNFKSSYIPTLGADFSHIKINIEEIDYSITLWDLSGQPKFDKVTPQYFLGSHGAIVVYDILDQNAEENVIKWIDTYLENINRSNVPILVIQNKIDLLTPQNEHDTKVSHKKLTEKLKINYKNKAVIHSNQTSAKTTENVHSSFNEFFKFVIDNIAKDLGKRAIPLTSEINSDVPSSYLISFDEYLGPKIIVRNPPSPTFSYSAKEETSAVRTLSSLSYDELIDDTYNTGMITWLDPKSTFYFIAFVLPNENTRGGYDLIIGGFNAIKEYKNVLLSKLNIIEGKLLQLMNELVEILSNYDYDILDEEELMTLAIESNYQLDRILFNLRLEIHNLIHESV